MEVKETIPELRQLLQAPRKAVDTWYGRHVMRAASIYLTRIAVRRGFTPNQITAVSLIVGLLSALAFFFRLWFLGIVLINGWYLLDHVDGEVARYTKASSHSGFFFDTVINYIIEPFLFLGMGIGLSGWAGDIWLAFALFAAFGSVLLGLIPMCEDSVILTASRKAGKLPVASQASADGSTHSVSGLRHVFSAWHFSITFPSVILSLTAIGFVMLVTRWPLAAGFRIYLAYYAMSITVIWIAQLIHKVRTRKLDQVLF